MATLNPERPEWSAYIWHDGRDLFLQLPRSTHVTKFILNEAGLSKALKLLPKAPPNSYVAPKPTNRRKDPLDPNVMAALDDIMKDLK